LGDIGFATQIRNIHLSCQCFEGLLPRDFTEEQFKDADHSR